VKTKSDGDPKGDYSNDIRPAKAHYNTTLSENNLHSEPLPACLLMVTPKMANADKRHESATALELPRHLLGTYRNY
jgi:hypothetical protein